MKSFVDTPHFSTEENKARAFAKIDWQDGLGQEANPFPPKTKAARTYFHEMDRLQHEEIQRDLMAP